jgi:hypothetical protein
MRIDDAVVTNLVDGVDPYSSLHGSHSETVYLIQIGMVTYLNVPH